MNSFLKLFRSNAETTADAELMMSFEGLNPLLAKQLSELETQIGQLAQVQYDLAQERQRMRAEMEALRKAIGGGLEEVPFPTTENGTRQ